MIKNEPNCCVMHNECGSRKSLFSNEEKEIIL